MQTDAYRQHETQTPRATVDAEGTPPVTQQRRTSLITHPAPKARPGNQPITYASLSSAQKKYAKQLHEDEGWSMQEAVRLAHAEGAA